MSALGLTHHVLHADMVTCRNRIGFCKTCLALLLVGCIFTGMYLYIRFTYLIGFKQ